MIEEIKENKNNYRVILTVTCVVDIEMFLKFRWQLRKKPSVLQFIKVRQRTSNKTECLLLLPFFIDEKTGKQK